MKVGKMQPLEIIRKQKNNDKMKEEKENKNI